MLQKSKIPCHTPSFMILPSMACQASCKYCFGPHKGAIMDEKTAIETVRFIKSIAEETGARTISITFHGGEPLLAPPEIWKILLGNLTSELSAYRLDMGLQSNLWNLTDEHLELLCRYNVDIGTSLDGPKEQCDTNRGDGYFERTRASMDKAAAAGKRTSVIATITRQTLPYAKDILTYFGENRWPAVMHTAVSAIDGDNSPYTLTVGEYTELMKDLLPWYANNSKNVSVCTFDHMIKGIVNGDPCVCTFKDCFGLFLAISPTGDITSCQRFAGKKEHIMGNIFDKPTLRKLYSSSAAKKQLRRQNRVRKKCSGCTYYDICKGGCYYNSLAAGGDIDPLCEGYKSVFGFIQDEVVREMAEPENMRAVEAEPNKQGVHPLLRRGKFIDLAYEPHPCSIASNARKVLGIYEMGRTADDMEAAKALTDAKICSDTEYTASLIRKMREGLAHCKDRRNNCYIHITMNCNLRCTHCYASAGDSKDEMPIENIEKLMKEAIAAGFRQIVLTGGEPMVHSKRGEFIRLCKKYRGQGVNLVLRTNLYGKFTDSELAALADSVDQVVVSVDGSEETHDERRGKGSYRSTVANCERYAAIAGKKNEAGELSLACVMRAKDINGEPGESVRRLGERLNVRRVRFRPLLPLGRAADMDEPVMCEGLMEHIPARERLYSDISPLGTCGIGQNIFIKPDGSCYPCYAWCGEHVFLGNACENGLESVLESDGFKTLLACTVDTMEKCRECEYRYLCGGACRAWGNTAATDVNAAPPDCGHLKQRARELIEAAREYLAE